MFGKRVRLCTLFGTDILLDTSWILIVVLVAWSLATDRFPRELREETVGVYWTLGVLGGLALLGSIVAHEAAHAWVARREGLEVRAVVLYPFGGIDQRAADPLRARAEFRAAAAGPFASLAVGLLLHDAAQWAYAWPGLVAVPVRYLAAINLALGAFNLVPAYPLDGGRMLRAAWWAKSGDLASATRLVSRSGRAAGLVLSGVGALALYHHHLASGLGYLVLGWFLRALARASYRRTLLSRALAGAPVRRFMRGATITIGPDLSVQAFVDHYLFRHTDKLYPVVDRGRFAGCVSLDAVLKVPKLAWRERRVGEIAERCAGDATIGPDDDALEALARMQRAGATRLLVTSEGQLDGVVALQDLLDVPALLQLRRAARPSLLRRRASRRTARPLTSPVP